MTSNNSEYIKIYEHKRIPKSEGAIDVLHLDDICLATKIPESNEYIIKSGKYKDRMIKELDTNYQNIDFCADALTFVEKNLLRSEEDTEVVANYLKISPYKEYQIISNKNGHPFLESISDEKIKDEYKTACTPSLSEKISDEITNPNGFAPFLDSNIIDQITGRTNSLLMQTPTRRIASIEELDINKKYESLKHKIIGLDRELKVFLANITKNVSLAYSGLPGDKVKEIKSSILIMGPRGTGKTFMIESVSREFDVLHTIEDATRYTPAAWKGGDIDDILVNLSNKAMAADKDADSSIIYIDEFDKMCKRTAFKEHNLTEEFQNNLLTIIQGTTINKKILDGSKERIISIDTSKMTFVLAGAFDELSHLEEITTDDLINYGVIPQLANRINCVIKTKFPSKEDLRKALTEGEYSYINLLKEYLAIFNKSIEVDNDFIDYIVEIAYAKKAGYRGLSIALSEYINTILFDFYASNRAVIKLQKP